MASVQLLLGKTRWRRRRAVPRQKLSGEDRFGQPTFLYLTDTQRKKSVVEQEYLAYRRHTPTFKPTVRVLSELFDDLQLRFGDGRAILSDRMASLAAERVLTEHSDRWDWLGSLGTGRSVGQALAKLHREMAEARCKRLTDIPHGTELHSALAELGKVLRAIPGHTTGPRALEDLLKMLHMPTAPLMEWLRSVRSVVIDDVLQPSPLRREVLIALCRAWSAAGVHVVVSFESGRDLGGREAELFFEYGDVDDVAYPLKPFLATRSLRRACFDALIGEDDGSLMVSLREGLVEVEPGSIPAQIDDEDLSDFLYSGRAIPCDDPTTARAWLGDTVRLLECADPEAEIREIARQVKSALLDGEEARHCVVALPELSVYAPAVRAVFTDHGIPFSISAGMRLAQSPVADAVRRLVTLALDDFPVVHLLPLLRSDLVHTPDGIDPTEVYKWCRAGGVVGGHPSTWHAPIAAWMHRERYPGVDDARLTSTLEALASFCEPFADFTAASTPVDFRDRLIDLATKVGIPDNLGRSEDAPGAAAENLHAWGAVLRAVDQLTLDLQTVDPGHWPADILAGNLDDALHQASFHPDPQAWSRVQVVGVLDLRGLTPRRTWLGGLSRGAFPAPRGTPFLVPRRAERALEPVEPLAEARYLFGSLLRNALGDTNMLSLVMSWPATRDARPVAPSPVLADLLDLPTEHPAGKLFSELVVEHPSPGHGRPLSRSDALRATAMAPSAWLPVLSPADVSAVNHQRAVLTARSSDDFTPFDGILDTPPAAPDVLSVTKLETYLQCPARYWYRYVLKLDPVEDWDDELDARRRGSVIHEILEVFLQERMLQTLTGARIGEASAHLYQVATRLLDQLDKEGGFEPALQAHNRTRWLAGLLDDEPDGVLRVWLGNEIWSRKTMHPVSVEEDFEGLQIGTVKLRGKADRIDRVEDHGLLVTDYKTGTAPSANQIRRGLVLQPIAYAEATAKKYPDEPVASVYYSLKNPHQLRRVGWCGDAAVYDDLKKYNDDAVELTADNRARLLDHAAEAVRKLSKGQFHTTLASPEEAKCKWCGFRRVCRVDPPRNARVHDTDGDWHRPLSEPTDGES